MNRRELLVAAAAIAATAPVLSAEKAAAGAHDHHHHHPSGQANKALIESAAHCGVTGEICLAHCHELLAEGDKAMAECAQAVNQLIAVCGALRSVAIQNGSALKAMAKVALDVCRECEEACRKHEKKHQQCKDCADACADCAKACKSVVA